MENTNNAINMTLGEMKRYLSEWFLGTNFKIVAGEYDTFNRQVVITEENSDLVLFARDFDVKELITDESIVSTDCIKNDELRGLVEQCYRLDKQLEEIEKEKASKASTANQKQ